MFHRRITTLRLFRLDAILATFSFIHHTLETFTDKTMVLYDLYRLLYHVFLFGRLHQTHLEYLNSVFKISDNRLLFKNFKMCKKWKNLKKNNKKKPETTHRQAMRYFKKQKSDHPFKSYANISNLQRNYLTSFFQSRLYDNILNLYVRKYT